MYALTIVANTTAEHPDHGRLGEAFVGCWVERDTEQEAEEVARALIVADGWEVVRTEEISVVNAEDYEDDEEYRQYYEQALEDKEVFVFHVCPRHPVYFLRFAITSDSSDENATEARVWISNEAIDDDSDPLDPAFWSGERVEKAIALAIDVITNNGYQVASTLEQSPCSRDETSDDCEFYDDAEADGLCLVFDPPESPDDSENAGSR